MPRAQQTKGLSFITNVTAAMVLVITISFKSILATFQSQNLDQTSKSQTNISLKILQTIQIQNLKQTLLRIRAMRQIQNHKKHSASKAPQTSKA